MSELRQDLINSAVSFLSSANVQSADKSKKVAFLEKKGLTQAEIDEAFNRVGTPSTTTTTDTTPTTVAATVNTAPPTAAPAVNNNLAPILPARNTQPQIIYYPVPPPPPVATGRVLALAVIAGIGAVGLTASIIAVLRRFIGRIFTRIANYQRTRYTQHRELHERLLTKLKTYNDENDDLDAVIDQGDEKSTTDALIKHQQELKSKLDTLATEARSIISESNAYKDFEKDLASFRSVIVGPPSTDVYAYSNSFVRNPHSDSAAVSGLKSDIRSLKAVLLNRRNFPTA